MVTFEDSSSVERWADVLMGLERYGMVATTKLGEAAARRRPATESTRRVVTLR